MEDGAPRVMTASGEEDQTPSSSVDVCIPALGVDSWPGVHLGACDHYRCSGRFCSNTSNLLSYRGTGDLYKRACHLSAAELVEAAALVMPQS